MLRLLDISPRDGSRVESSTELVAHLSYVIPDFDPSRRYRVTALFAQTGGGMSSLGSADVPLQAPVGIVTVRGPMQSSNGVMRSERVSPLTGVFYLMRQDTTVASQDTVVLGNEMRVRIASRSFVEARSRTFYYNGAGPARSLGSGLSAILEEYWTYRTHKALAVAYDSAARWAYGYSYGRASPDSAVARALVRCKAAAAQSKITAPCELVASDSASAR